MMTMNGNFMQAILLSFKFWNPRLFHFYNKLDKGRHHIDSTIAKYK